MTTPLARLAPLALLLAPVASFAGYYFESTSTTSGPADQVVSVHGWVDGPNAKIEFQDNLGMFRAGSYVVTNAETGASFIVNPADMTIMEMDIDDMLATLGTMLNVAGGLVQFTFSDYTSEKLEEGPGERLLGYRTTHYKFRTGYTMTFKVLGMGRSNRITSENELWCTEALDDVGFRSWFKPDRMRTGNAEIDEMIEKTYADIDCLPLRSRVVQTSSEGRGRSETSTVVTEMSSIEERSVPASTFELPAGYERVALPTVGNLQQMIEQAERDEQAAQPEPEPKKEEGGRRGLRGLRDALRGL